VGCGIEPRNKYIAGAEAVAKAEGNMCGADMRGTVALPGSKATSRTNGTRWNLGDLVPPGGIRATSGSRRDVAVAEGARSRTAA
jgi:hypothetical protein